MRSEESLGGVLQNVLYGATGQQSSNVNILKTPPPTHTLTLPILRARPHHPLPCGTVPCPAALWVKSPRQSRGPRARLSLRFWPRRSASAIRTYVSTYVRVLPLRAVGAVYVYRHDRVGQARAGLGRHFFFVFSFGCRRPAGGTIIIKLLRPFFLPFSFPGPLSNPPAGVGQHSHNSQWRPRSPPHSAGVQEAAQDHHRGTGGGELMTGVAVVV